MRLLILGLALSAPLGAHAGSPLGPRASATEIQCLMAAGDADAARPIADSIVRQMPDDLGGLALLADVCLAQGDLSCSRDSVEWMLAMRPEDDRGLLRAARLSALWGDEEGASRLLALVHSHLEMSDPDERERVVAFIDSVAAELPPRRDGLAAVHPGSDIPDLDPSAARFPSRATRRIRP